MSAAEGYSPVTKWLHWVTFAALLAQFTVGYAMDVEDSGHGRGRGRGGESGRGRGRGGDESVLDQLGDDGLLTVHVVLGLTILTLALVRVLWRRATELPPWAETLSDRERWLAHWTERVLYVVLFLIPLSGLGLLFLDDDLLALHVAAHITFFVAFAAHLSLVLKHLLVDRDGLLTRML